MHKAWKIVGGVVAAAVVLRLFGMALGRKPGDTLAPGPVATAEPAATSGQTPPSSAGTLPDHVVVGDEPLPPRTGHRIEVRVRAVLLLEDCRRLVDAYRRRGSPDGQVVVSVRVRDKSGETDLPVCVENFDGKGAQEGIATATLRAMKGAEILPLPPH